MRRKIQEFEFKKKISDQLALLEAAMGVSHGDRNSHHNTSKVPRHLSMHF